MSKSRSQEGPIKPKEVQSRKYASLPEEVFEIFNRLILDDWNGHEATVYQRKAAKLIAKALNTSTKDVYDRRLLDIESVYRKAGWKVTYDKPGYCENYEAFFQFRK